MFAQIFMSFLAEKGNFPQDFMAFLKNAELPMLSSEGKAG